jgi:hypothetical protein
MILGCISALDYTLLMFVCMGEVGLGGERMATTFRST